MTTGYNTRVYNDQQLDFHFIFNSFKIDPSYQWIVDVNDGSICVLKMCKQTNLPKNVMRDDLTVLLVLSTFDSTYINSHIFLFTYNLEKFR